MKRKVSDAQDVFDFDAPIPLPPPPLPVPSPEPVQDSPRPLVDTLDKPGRKLDAEGHFYWAQLCRNGQEMCIKRAGEDEENGAEWARIAATYKAAAAKHEAQMRILEGLRG